ncbi:MAG: oligosaccharide flippase family protein [Prevotella sp.]|nr:oligosaccharide flippase family protein [Prevotella sp.]
MFIEKIFKGDPRTSLIKKNIAASILIKGWSCIIQFLLVPITLNCLSKYEYGIWLTISSILIWIDQFDIGLGNGLRNRLAEAVARKENERARILVSTTFVGMFAIVMPIIILFITAIQTIDCYSLLNISPIIIPNLNGILIVSVSLVGATFIFKFIGNVYLGLQMPAVNNLLVVGGQTISLFAIYILSLIGIHSFFTVAVIYTASPLIVYLISYPITFNRYKYLSPRISLFCIKEIKGLFALGVKFFLVQIAGLVIFASSNLLISNIISPTEVTSYQIAYKYFSILIMVFTIISAPLWSATTDAYTKNDWKWINTTMRKMRNIMYALAGVLVIMVTLADLFYSVWVGKSIQIELSLSVSMAIYIAVLIYSTCYSNILFGIGKIKLITIITCFEAIIYIPTAIYFGKMHGLQGIVWSLIAVNMLCAICNRIQFSKLANSTATGIWNT